MATAKPRTLAEFRATHDRSVVVPNKIRNALAELIKIGPEHFEYESEFIKRAGLSQADIGAYREQFSDHIIEAKVPGKGSNARRAWFGDKKVAAKLRD